MVILNLIYSAFVMPIIAVWNYQSSWPFGRIPCKIQAFVKTTFMTADGLIIIMIGE